MKPIIPSPLAIEIMDDGTAEYLADRIGLELQVWTKDEYASGKRFPVTRDWGATNEVMLALQEVGWQSSVTRERDGMYWLNVRPDQDYIKQQKDKKKAAKYGILGAVGLVAGTIIASVMEKDLTGIVCFGIGFFATVYAAGLRWPNIRPSGSAGSTRE